ncbi:MAG: low temperature requirement protein A [Candidatus Gracilibacteria bacterium]|nr:low temperature requirement protein A [Candidatus Gracilibacteria bacterium]
MNSSFNWRKPILHDHSDNQHDHKATWLELFYDLVFVVAIAELTHRLSLSITWRSFGIFVFLFIPIWWNWISVTFYNDRFETGDISQRLFTFLHMIAIGTIAFQIHKGVINNSNGFALAYIFCRVIIVIMWLRAKIHNPEIKNTINKYLAGFSISILLWTISLWVDFPWKFILWSIALLIELITPLTTLKEQSQNKMLQRSPHLPERFGLFMIIVLGESVVGIFHGLNDLSYFNINSVITALLGATFAFMIWWLYFDFINPRPIKKGPYHVATWAYAHFPLIISISALGASLLKLIQLNGGIIPINIIWLLCGSLALALVSIGVLENTLATYKNRLCSTPTGKIIRYGGALICLCLPFFSSLHIAWRILGILIIVVVSQIVHSESSICHVHHENVLNDLNQ